MNFTEGFESKYNLPPDHPGIWKPPDSPAPERKPPAKRKRAAAGPVQRGLFNKEEKK
jgi:hypothetical protein